MKDLEVRIVKLEPLRVAHALGFGAQPEDLAWSKLLTWAKAKSLLSGPVIPRFFGFNNPSPSQGSPHYGYETWITVGPEVQPEGEMGVKEFRGGLYAVTHIKGPEDEIFPTWQKLVAWVEKSRYTPARHQWLEEHFWDQLPDPNHAELDLMMPIA